MAESKTSGTAPALGTPYVPRIEASVNLKRPMPWKALPGKSKGSVHCGLVVGLVFWALFIYHLVTMFVTIGGGNMHGEIGNWEAKCGSVSIDYVGHERLGDDILDDLCKCRARNRRLDEDDYDAMDHRTMLDLMSDYVHIPITGVLMILVVAVAWLLLLKYLGTSFIILSLGLIFGILMTITVLFLKYNLIEAGIVMLIMTLSLGGYCAFRHKMVLRAGKTIETAASGLFANPSLFGVLVPLEVAFICYIFLWIEAQACYSNHGEVRKKNCELRMQSSSTTIFLVNCVFTWVAFYIDHVKVNVVSSTLSHWAFGQTGSKGGCNLALKALRWSFFESSPTIACTSLVSSIVEFVKRAVESKIYWCNPLCWIPLCIACCLLNTVKQFGRFCVVLHGVTGSPFTTCAADSFHLLIKGGNLEHALSANYFASFSLALFSWVLSMAIGMLMFLWVDHESDTGITEVFGDLFDDADWGILWIVLFSIGLICFAIMNRWPYFLLWIIMIIAPLLENAALSVFLFGMFCTAITHIVFKFFSILVLDAVDTMVICYCIDKDNGTAVAAMAVTKSPKVVAMYALLDEMVKDTGGDSQKVQPLAVVAVQPYEGEQPKVQQMAVMQSPAPIQVINVNVPAGAIPGQSIVVMTPAGQMSVVIPAGVGVGQFFQVQMPAAPIQAQVVQAQVVVAPQQEERSFMKEALTFG